MNVRTEIFHYMLFRLITTHNVQPQFAVNKQGRCIGDCVIGEIRKTEPLVIHMLLKLSSAVPYNVTN